MGSPARLAGITIAIGDEAPEAAPRRLHALSVQRRVLRNQECTHREIFVELWPVDPDTTTDETPVAKGIRTGIAQLREPFERHGDGTAVFKVDHQLAGDDVAAGLAAFKPDIAGITSTTPVDVIVCAVAINFLLISDGSAVLRYST